MKLSIKNSEKYVFEFDYINIDPKFFFFFQHMLDFFFFYRLLEIKKIIEGLKCIF